MRMDDCFSMRHIFAGNQRKNSPAVSIFMQHDDWAENVSAALQMLQRAQDSSSMNSYPLNKRKRKYNRVHRSPICDHCSHIAPKGNRQKLGRMRPSILTVRSMSCSLAVSSLHCVYSCYCTTGTDKHKITQHMRPLNLLSKWSVLRSNSMHDHPIDVTERVWRLKGGSYISTGFCVLLFDSK